MKLRNGLIAIAVVLTASFLVLDWMAFFRCGAVERCLMEGSSFQNIAKCAVTAIMTLVVFSIGKERLCLRDRTLLQASFAVALCADFCFKILHEHLIGVCFFMATQALLIVRHTRRNETDNSFPVILYVPFGAMCLAAVPCLFSSFSGVMLPVVAAYGSFVVCSLVVACRVPKKGFFPARNARQIKWGMILFFCCDVCVGLSGLVSVDYSAQEIVATVAHNFVWAFYTPALILLALSGYRQDS